MSAVITSWESVTKWQTITFITKVVNYFGSNNGNLISKHEKEGTKNQNQKHTKYFGYGHTHVLRYSSRANTYGGDHLQ